MSQIISTNWLQKNINNKRLVVFDCSWYMPNEKRKPKKDYKNQHIKGAYFFDIEDISDKKSFLPHMLPSINDFTRKTKKFNIHKNSIIILYSLENVIGSARVWWMFKYFGFKKIYVLNGNLNKWIKEKKQVTKIKSIYKKSTIKYKIHNSWLATKNNIVKNFDKNNKILIDARNSNRFNGFEKEKSKNLLSGHIPKSQNIYWKIFIKEDGTFVPKNMIKKKFIKYNLLEKKAIFTCGSGISACLLCLSLKHVLDINSSVYDGSWAEWGLKKK